MIGIILDILAIDDFYGISKEIDIAKGINKTPLTLKEGYKKAKRKWSQRR